MPRGTGVGRVDASDEAVESAAARGALTLAERFIGWFRLPYLVGAVLLGGVCFGFLSSSLSLYAEPMPEGEQRDLSAAILAALAPDQILIYTLVVWAFYVPRYMRQKVEQAGAALAPLHPDREEGYRAAFARVSAIGPQLITWSVFLALLLLALSVPALMGTGPSLVQLGEGSDPTGLGDAASIFSIVSFAAITLALSSVVWSYWSVSTGIRRFGGSALGLRPYYEDGFLGLRPVGTLSLSLAIAYFTFIGLFLAALLASPTPPTVADLAGMGSLLMGLVLLGLLLFFLPMKTLHERMTVEKQVARERLTRELAPWFRESSAGDPPGDVREMLRLDLMERKVSAMALWPFDTAILGRLSVIAFSVTAILISRIVALYLGI